MAEARSVNVQKIMYTNKKRVYHTLYYAYCFLISATDIIFWCWFAYRYLVDADDFLIDLPVAKLLFWIILAIGIDVISMLSSL